MWHRMPFLSLLTSSLESPSFYPALTEASGNFAIANYGAAQGIDTDDGSSFNFIHHNFFYQADGFKMVRGQGVAVFLVCIISRVHSGYFCFSPLAPFCTHPFTYFRTTAGVTASLHPMLSW